MTLPAGSIRAVAIDGGRTGVRVAEVSSGCVELIATGPGLPLLAVTDGPAQVARAIAEQIPTGASIESLGGGLTGLGEARGRVPELVDQLRHLTGARVVTLASDIVTSHLGALRGRPGVVAAAGTGSVTLALRRDGTAAKVDGWGYLLGDAGSGYDIGRKGLLSAMAHHDGRGGSSLLLAAACRRFGDLDGLSAQLYESTNPAADMASFAPSVVSLARKGDPTSRSIFEETVAALAIAIEGAANRAALQGVERAWSWAGSILGLEDLVRDPLERLLAGLERPLEAVPPAGGALEGAALLLDPAVRRWLGPLAHTSSAGE